MDQPRRLLLIINPISGVGDKNDIEALVYTHLKPSGYEITTSYTCARGDATRLAENAVKSGFYGVKIGRAHV